MGQQQASINRANLGLLKLSHAALSPLATVTAQRPAAAPRTPHTLGAAWQAVHQTLGH